MTLEDHYALLWVNGTS